MRFFRKPSPIPTVLCVPLAVLAAAAMRFVLLMPPLARELRFHVAQSGLGELARDLLDDGPATALLAAGPGATGALSAVLTVCGGLWALVSVVGVLFRRPWALAAIRAGWAAVVFAAVLHACVAFLAAGVIDEAYKAAFPDATGTGMLSFGFQWSFFRWDLLAALLAAGMLVLSWRGRTFALYSRPVAGGVPVGDGIVESIRTGGRDPSYRGSWLSSVGVHWFVIVALPFLWALRGCVEPYLVPYGRGRPRVTRVMRVVKRKKKERKKYLLSMNRAIIWDIPDLNQSNIAKEVEEQTQMSHVADRNAVFGQMGAGDGTKGGWPDGVPGGKIRFIRLEYRGRDWDDGMDGRSRADINFLAFLKKEVPFPVARKSESHAVSRLSRYPKGLAPPFVYMTGSETIYTSRTDRKILREYLLDGGMLFADCGSRRWDHSFRGFIKSVFPDKRLIDIADDDEIFQMPYSFANGAPPLWHHGGFRALGVKHRGRWVVFYHPGDINDAWKVGHSGMDAELADKAYQMGINILYYSITKYLQMTRKYRKR
jgi:hypothetical protein